MNTGQKQRLTQVQQQLREGKVTGTCAWCGLRVAAADTCVSTLQIRCRLQQGDRVKHSGGKRCKSCNVLPDGYHHPTCKREQCPFCEKPFLKCFCSLIE